MLDRIWKEVSIDYITDLPKSFQCSNLMVMTDRLSKGVIIELLQETTAETTALAFLRRVIS